MKKFALLFASTIFGTFIYLAWVNWFPSAREPGYQFITSWGTQGTDQGQFHDPTGIAVHNNEVYVADSRNSRIQVFDMQGNYKRQFGTSKILGRPMNMAIHNNKIYIADYWKDRIVIFTLEGAYIGSIGKSGNGQAEFHGPGGVSISPHGTLFVVDFYNHRVQELSLEGKFIRQIGKTGQSSIKGGYFGYPTDVAISHSGTVFVADGYNDRIQVFNPQGSLLFKWGGPFAMNIPGPFNAWFATITSLAIDAHANIFVVDFYNHRIQKFDSVGTFLVSFGKMGTNLDELKYPFGVAVAHDGSVFVTDSGHHRIQKWSQIISTEP